jgi:regulator of nucleoside diphosphate kinase
VHRVRESINDQLWGRYDSILAPLGTALLGFRVGDVVDWQMPAGTRKLRIDEILYQPEASGDYHL